MSASTQAGQVPNGASTRKPRSAESIAKQKATAAKTAASKKAAAAKTSNVTQMKPAPTGTPPATIAPVVGILAASPAGYLVSLQTRETELVREQSVIAGRLAEIRSLITATRPTRAAPIKAGAKRKKAKARKPPVKQAA